jgi:hypothetical protein
MKKDGIYESENNPIHEEESRISLDKNEEENSNLLFNILDSSL